METEQWNSGSFTFFHHHHLPLPFFAHCTCPAPLHCTAPPFTTTCRHTTLFIYPLLIYLLIPYPYSYMLSRWASVLSAYSIYTLLACLGQNMYMYMPAAHICISWGTLHICLSYIWAFLSLISLLSGRRIDRNALLPPAYLTPQSVVSNAIKS